jgi:redox-sensitive bicupin YhaK (pirin superfamily)
VTIDVRRAADRFHTDLGWLDSWHSFSFGNHYDPANVGHGLLIVSNDDTVRAGGGFGTHGHADMEIVTWVLTGELEHRDSEGNHGVLSPGIAQRMSAGTGIRHSEMNASDTVDVHFVQMWVLPDTAGVAPGYEQRDVNEVLDAGGFAAVASGQGHAGAVSIHQRGAVLWAARLHPNRRAEVPGAAHTHVFVALGSGALEGVGPLATGDAVRVTGDGIGAFEAGPDGAEVLVWATD